MGSETGWTVSVSLLTECVLSGGCMGLETGGGVGLTGSGTFARLTAPDNAVLPQPKWAGRTGVSAETVSRECSSILDDVDVFFPALFRAARSRNANKRAFASSNR